MNKRSATIFGVGAMVTAVAVGGAGTTSASDDGPTAVLFMAEALTTDGTVIDQYFLDEDEMAPWIQSDLGNKQISSDYVYGDPRNALFDGGEPGVTHGIHPTNDSSDANLADPQGVMRSAVATWDDLTCSDLDLVENGIDQNFPGIVRTFFSGGGLPLIQKADLTQVGFFSPAQFPYFAANPNVLGVAFTLVWSGPDGLTDIDGNGKTDVAFREIYYNDAYNWADDGILGARGSGYFDFPAVAIHEVGHGFSQAHFGNIDRDGTEVIARPKAVMNAIYGGIQRDLTGTDVGGHCSNWSNWPNL